VDASYEGDLLALAGVPYRVGRESTSEYGESMNGVVAESCGHQFDVRVDPYRRAGDAKSGLLPIVEPPDGAEPGAADDRVEAYCFRLCLTREESNRAPLGRPERYQPERFELLARLVDGRRRAGRETCFSDLFLVSDLPNEKADFNNYGPISTDHVGANAAYPEGDLGTRRRIWLDHVEYTRGLFHFLSTDARIPESVRRETSSWGLCRDEFTDDAGWPHQLYVREARRMIGEYVMTQAHCEGRVVAEDTVAVASYPIDSHHCRRTVVDGAARNEGDLEVKIDPYPVSYRALTPRAEHCENLLVPVCLSATHVAFGSLRTETVFMELGQAAGLAASHAAASGKSVQEIDVARLRAELRQSGAVLEPPGRVNRLVHRLLGR
jgi:hypothetical protein